MSDYVATIAAKRYHLYLKEEERKSRHSGWMQSVIAAILWLVKLITNSLETVNIKSKRIIEKVTVEQRKVRQTSSYYIREDMEDKGTIMMPVNDR
jgi:hypothetical protein